MWEEIFVNVICELVTLILASAKMFVIEFREYVPFTKSRKFNGPENFSKCAKLVSCTCVCACVPKRNRRQVS